VEEITALAASLAEMAQSLKEIVARFKLDENARVEQASTVARIQPPAYIGPDRRTPLLEGVKTGAKAGTANV
jgi:hypothetical protein